MAFVNVIMYNNTEEVISKLIFLAGAYFWIIVGLLLKIIKDIEEMKLKNSKEIEKDETKQ
jgi:hypothetical protein